MDENKDILQVHGHINIPTEKRIDKEASALVQKATGFADISQVSLEQLL